MKTTTILGMGFIGLLLLAILAIVLAGSWIEDDLAAQAIRDLEAAGQDWASVSVDGRDATLTGTAPTADAAKGAVNTISDVWGVRAVIDEITSPE
jgi:osmotically-inducible protein OsmY